MESQIIEKIGKVRPEITIPKLQSTYPNTRVKGRLITTKVVGVTFEGRQEVIARLQMGDRVWLEMEPENQYDPNAIKICRSNGEQIGYLSRKLAVSILPHFRIYGYPVKGKVTLLTGSTWGSYSLGVIISFKLPKVKASKSSTLNSLFTDWDKNS